MVHSEAQQGQVVPSLPLHDELEGGASPRLSMWIIRGEVAVDRLRMRRAGEVSGARKDGAARVVAADVDEKLAATRGWEQHRTPEVDHLVRLAIEHDAL